MVELGESMVHIKSKPRTSLSLRGGAFKGAVAWTNTFLFALKYPQLIMNLAPFPRKKIRVLAQGFAVEAHVASTYTRPPSLKSSTLGFYKSDKLSFKCLSPIWWKTRGLDGHRP